MMRYRATLTDPGNKNQDHPQTILSCSRTEIDQWTGKILAKAISPDAFVDIFETTERKIEFVVKPKPEVKA